MGTLKHFRYRQIVWASAFADTAFLTDRCIYVQAGIAPFRPLLQIVTGSVALKDEDKGYLNALRAGLAVFAAAAEALAKLVHLFLQQSSLFSAKNRVLYS